MKLNDPISIHIAGTNLEAQMIADHLTALGIPAYAVEDTSGVSTFSFGVISQFHKPMVYAERAQAEEARKVIEDYEDTATDAETGKLTDDEPPDYCTACGERVAHGTPTCPECERPIEWPDEEDDAQGADEYSRSLMSTLKAWKKPMIILLFGGTFVLGILIPELIRYFQLHSRYDY